MNGCPVKLYLLTLAPVMALSAATPHPKTYTETDAKMGISPDVPGVSEVTCEPGDKPLTGGCQWDPSASGHLYAGPLLDDDGAFIGWTCIGLPDESYPRLAVLVCQVGK